MSFGYSGDHARDLLDASTCSPRESPRSGAMPDRTRPCSRRTIVRRNAVTRCIFSVDPHDTAGQGRDETGTSTDTRTLEHTRSAPTVPSTDTVVRCPGCAGHNVVDFHYPRRQHFSDPTASAFRLADGPLHITDLIHDNQGRRELAFLSACQTVTGSPRMVDEAVHLAAAMQHPGRRLRTAPCGRRVAGTVARRPWSGRRISTWVLSGHHADSARSPHRK
jgi:hypothetical protein